MPHDAARLADTRAWLSKAMRDIRTAEVVLAAEPPLLEDALFHCQQAAEKALKALLAWHDRPFRRTHDLSELGRQCIALVPDLETLLIEVAPLSEYAWRFRYPGEPEEPAPAEAREALVLARRVVHAIRAHLPDEPASP
ncbi:MAG: HEPN domain-containing protein [Anaerolineae bacterium]